MSRKTIGAPSTNPPAVMGRDFASFTGACAPPVDIPEGFTEEGDCGVCGFGGEDCCSNAAGAESKTRRSNAKKTLSQFEGSEECAFICRPRVAEVHQLAGSDRRARFSEFVRSRWASGFRWIGQRVRGRGRSGRACRSNTNSCPPWKQ